MKANKMSAIIPGIVLLSCSFALVYWLYSNTNVSDFSKRLPVKQQPMIQTKPEVSNEPSTADINQQPVPNTPAVVNNANNLSGMPASGEPPSIPGSWPMFRGASSDNISNDSTKLSSNWSASPPKTLWSIDVGEGHAGAAVFNSRVYLLDYDRNAQQDVIRCLSFADGRQLWSYAYPVSIKRNHGMSRTIPAVNDKYVVTLGPKCHVVCADAKSGKVLWTMDLVKQYGTTIPPWYAGQCPLLDGDKVIIAPSGRKVLMMAVDCASGKILWQTPNTPGWSMTHSSIMPMNLLGQKTYVYCGSGGVIGVSAENGRQLWLTTLWKVRIANVPSPVQISNDKLFLSGGYNSGSMMIRLSKSGSSVAASSVFKLQPRIFGSDQQTPVFYKGYIYGVIPGGQLACLSLDGKQIWNSGPDRFGLGPYVAAGGHLYVLADNGVLSLIDLNSRKYTKLSQLKVLNGTDAWAPIAAAGGRMIMRDLTRMVCLDVSSKR